MKLPRRTRPGAVLFALAAAVLAFAAPATGQVRPGLLPDFTDLYEKQAPAVVSIDVTQKARRGRFPELAEDDPFYEFFRRFGQVPRGRGAPEREPEAQSVGSGFIISSRRLPHHQRARRRRRRRGQGQPRRQARLQGQGRRRRQAHRHRAAQDRREGPAQGQHRRSREAQGRRVGGRDRQALRPRQHDDRRHRQRQGTRPAAGEPRPVHPDRRRDQPRQLRRAAVQPQGRGRRHQFADLLALGRLHGARVRDPDRRRDDHGRPSSRTRAR